MNSFTGSFTIQATPFTSDGSRVSTDTQRKFVEWQVKAGVPGLILFGTIGEFWSLSLDERRALIEVTLQQSAGRVPVLAGVAEIDTARACQLAADAHSQGVDGLMVSPPFYVNATEKEVYRHIAAICAETDLPVMLYNNPHTCGVDMTVEMVASLTSSFEQVRYIKEASSDLGRVHDIIHATDGVMRVFAGERVIESFQLGAVGYTSAYGTYAPEASVKVWELLLDGRFDDARHVQDQVDRIGNLINLGHPLYGHTTFTKALTRDAGHDLGDVRPPLTTLVQLGDAGEELLSELRVARSQLDQAVADTAVRNLALPAAHLAAKS